MLAFEERGKPESTEENLSVQNRTNKLNPQDGAESSNRTHIGGKRVLSLLHHSSANKAQTIFLLVQDLLRKKRYFWSVHLS